MGKCANGGFHIVNGRINLFLNKTILSGTTKPINKHNRVKGKKNLILLMLVIL